MEEALQRLYEQAEQARLSGDYTTAQSLLEQIAQACPSQACCHWSMGHVLMNSGDFDAAPVEFQTACDLEPDNPKFLLDLAKFLEMLGEFEQARPYLEKVLEVAPTSREASEAKKSLSYY